MECKDARPLLETYVDGELELGTHLLIEQHLRECPACQAAVAALELRRSVIREGLTRWSSPGVLNERIRTSLPAKSAPATELPRSKPKQRLWPAVTRWAAAMAAGLAIGLFGGYRWGQGRSQSDTVIARVVENHVRSLLPGHLTDVTSTDQHTVKPWFAGRLPFSPTVIDLASAGYPLIGGRLERIGEQPAAALVYQRGQHRLNLLIWPSAAGEALPARWSSDGYQVVSWTYSGFNYAVVSDIQERDLTQFAGLIREQLPH